MGKHMVGGIVFYKHIFLFAWWIELIEWARMGIEWAKMGINTGTDLNIAGTDLIYFLFNYLLVAPSITFNLN